MRTIVLVIVVCACGLWAVEIDIMGTVTTFDQKPISGVTATLVKQNMVTTTDADGVFRFPVSTAAQPALQSVKFGCSVLMHNGRLSVTLSRSDNISLQLYNLHGALMYTIHSGRLGQGTHTFVVPAVAFAQQACVLRVNWGRSSTQYKMLGIGNSSYLSGGIKGETGVLQTASAVKPLPQRSAVVDTIRLSHPDYYDEFFTFSKYVDTFSLVLGEKDWEKSYEVTAVVKFDDPSLPGCQEFVKIWPDPDAWLLDIIHTVLRVNYRDLSETHRIDDTLMLHVTNGPKVERGNIKSKSEFPLGQGYIYNQLKNGTEAGKQEIRGICYHEFGHMNINQNGYSSNTKFFEGKTDGQRYWCGGFPRTNASAGGNYDTESYQRLGFFFVWIEEEKVPQFTYWMNQYCKDGKTWDWDEDWPVFTAGMELPGIQELWDEYQETFN